MGGGNDVAYTTEHEGIGAEPCTSQDNAGKDGQSEQVFHENFSSLGKSQFRRQVDGRIDDLAAKRRFQSTECK